MATLFRALGALAALLSLSACLVTPGKFESSLDIRADGRFAFAYKGEIIASESGKEGMAPVEAGGEAEAGPALLQIAAKEEDFSAPEDKDEGAQMEAIAAALTKEKGFRSARYMGARRFEIDYAIDGTLTHAFLFPFNVDAQIVLPFIAAELRSDGRVRVKAPGFSNGFDKSAGPAGMAGGGEDAAKALDGRFTLTTDAVIVSQNEESGAQSVPQGMRIVWTITPQTSEAPMAVLRLAR